MSLFNQYIETPIQEFDTIDNVDSTLISIYSIMMNHQDYSIKCKNKYYIESIDSISHLAHCGRATTTRKINQLIEMGLLVRSWMPNKVNSWQVMPLDSLVSDWPRRKSNREEWEEKIKISLNQNELMKIENEPLGVPLNQNDSMNVQNDSMNVQNDSMNVQNDSGNNSNTNSIPTSLANSKEIEGEVEEVKPFESKATYYVREKLKEMDSPSTVLSSSEIETPVSTVSSLPTVSSLTVVPEFRSGDEAYNYVRSMGSQIKEKDFNYIFGTTMRYDEPDLNISVKRVYG